MDNCYYCQNILRDGICFNCPVKVLHYFNNDNELYCVELYYDKYCVDIYLKSCYERKGGDCYIVDTTTHFNNIELKENPNITPYNIQEKLKLLLTFQ
jgi:hypothetical protein